MDRRTFTGAFASLLIAGYRVEAQPATKVYRVGFLTYQRAEQATHYRRELIEGLRALGYVDGRNIVIEAHHGDGRFDSLPGLAAAIVRSRVDVIVTGSNPLAEAAKRATATITIVAVAMLDPVRFGLVANLARPGGNVTGLSVDASLHTAAKALNMEVYIAEVRTIDELDSAFAALSRNRVGAMIIRGSLFFPARQRVADLALKHRLPAIHGLKEFAEAGLLMSYGANLADLWRRAAVYVDRILKGARAGDLPVEQPTKFEMTINLRTAKALGLTVPQPVLVRADDVIR